MNVDIIKLKDPDNLRKLVTTLEEISNTITQTLGPNGHTAILYDGSTIPHVTKDGVTVAEFLKYDDPFKESINSIIKETARRTGQDVGDGTTTSVLLACFLASKALTYQGDIQELLRTIEADIRDVIAYIERVRVELDITSDEVFEILGNIINISSNGDTEVTELLLDVIHQIGVDGLIDVVLANNSDTTVSIRNGMLIEGPAMLVHKPITIGDAHVVLVSGGIYKVHEIKTTLELANKLLITKGLPTVIIAKEFGKEVQDIVLANNRNKKLEMYLVETDGFGPGMLEIMDDMATVLKCKVLSTDNTAPLALQNIDLEDLGFIKGGVISPNSTVLYPEDELDEVALEVKDSILAHIRAIKEHGEERVGELRHVEKRLSKFTKSATIYVGGVTDAEKIEKKDRVDDAVHALYSAIKGGVVPGAGSTLYRAAGILELSDLIAELCKLPATILHSNSNSEFKLETIYFNDAASVVVDYSNNDLGNAFELGVLDPADVQIKALTQALAVTKTLVNTHVLLIPTVKEWHGMQGG